MLFRSLKVAQEVRRQFKTIKGIMEEVEHDLEEEISESPFAVSYSGTKTSDRKQRGANIITQKTGTITYGFWAYHRRSAHGYSCGCSYFYFRE